MFDKKYMTRGVSAEISPILQGIMWTMIENMNVEKQDYLQVFKLEKVTKGSCMLQKISHTQEQPDYKHEVILIIPESEIVNAKVYVIDDIEYCTMLLAEEY